MTEIAAVETASQDRPTNERSRWIADRCRTYGYRLGTRLHVFVWGQERGR